MYRILSILSIVILLIMAALTLSAFSIHYWINVPLKLPENTLLTVNKGDSLSKVAYQLQADKVLSSARLFILYARLTKKTRIEIGEYLLKKNSSHKQLLLLLQSGDVIDYSVTLVEGKTFNEFLSKLHAHEKLRAVVPSSTAFQYDKAMAALGESNIAYPEGWFFPDTYRFVKGTSDKELLLQSHRRMKKVLAEEWENRAKNLPYKSAYEALIMASIIEKETGVAHERTEIAGVFVRRLQKGMRLQTDPTIIYGLGDDYTGNIRRKHLRQKTPYNTYVIDGLPPTPIAMPGREAIHAALHPKQGQSLYFVARGDGSHYFSSTLSEHNRAVRKYQIKKRRKNYQSSPQQ